MANDKEKGRARLSAHEAAFVERLESHASYLDKVDGLIRTYQEVGDHSRSSHPSRPYETPRIEKKGKKRGDMAFTVKANYDSQGINETRILDTESSGKRPKTYYFAIDREIGEYGEKLPSAEKLQAGHNLIDLLIRLYAESGLPTVAK